MEELTVLRHHEWLAEGVLRISAAGVGGIGSEGNANSAAMVRYVRAVEVVRRPTGVMLDCSDLEYEWGDSIGQFARAPCVRWGPGVHLCLLVREECAAAWDRLLEFGLLELMRSLLDGDGALLLVTTDRAKSLRHLGA